MKLKYKVYLSREVSSRLSLLGSRTGIQPNLLCRIGFCLSLEEPNIPDPRLFSGDKEGKEFNRYTLTGDWELFFSALLKQRMAQDGLDPDNDFDDQFTAHLGRGVLLLYDRVKSLRELRRLFPQVEIPAELAAEEEVSEYEREPADISGL